MDTKYLIAQAFSGLDPKFWLTSFWIAFIDLEFLLDASIENFKTLLARNCIDNNLIKN